MTDIRDHISDLRSQISNLRFEIPDSSPLRLCVSAVRSLRTLANPRLLPLLALVFLTQALSLPRPAQAYVEIPYSLGRLVQESTHIMVLKVEKVDKEKNLIIYRKVQELKGQYPGDVVKHNIARAGFHPREWQNIMEWAEPGKTAVFMHNGAASETCIDKYWYQAYPGDWWSMSHAEPYLLRSFAGKPEKLIPIVQAMLAGQEAIAPCMEDGNKEAIQLRTAKIMRMKVSLKLQDYNRERDFVGWGGEDFRLVAGMPGFTHLGAVGRVDPNAAGVAVADVNGDKKADFCLFGESRVSLQAIDGASLSEIALPVTGGARGAAFADYNRDGKPDLLLATPNGPKLLTNTGAGFRDDTAGLPQEGYYNLTACAWLDADGDGAQDIVLANGFLGLRVYKNLALGPAGETGPPKFGPWHYIGAFDGPDPSRFEKVFPPEQEIDLTKQYPGKGGKPIGWKQKDFVDGQVNPLTLFEQNDNAVAYVYREIEASAGAEIPASFGSDDTLTVWLNGEKLISENTQRGAAADQNQAVLKVKPGKNRLLLKITQGGGDFAFYFKAGESKRSVPPLFADASAAMGLGPQGVAGKAKGDHLAVADVNADGRADLLYSAGAGLLLLNTDKGFVEAKNSGVAFQAGRVAPVFGDFNGDKAIDLFVPQHTGASKLLANNGQGQFTDVTAKAGDLAKPVGDVVCAAFAGLGGKPHLYLGCLRGQNRYFENQGGGVFRDATSKLGLEQKVFNTRGLALADLNGDGAADAIFANEGQDSTVLLARTKTELAKGAE